MKKIINYFLHEDQNVKIFDLRRRYFLIKFSIIIILTLSIFSIPHIVTKNTISFQINMVALSIMALNLFYFKYKGNYKNSTIIFFATCTGVVTSHHYLGFTGVQINLIWAPLLAIASVFMTKRPYPLLLTVSYITSLCGAQYFGNNIPINLPEEKVMGFKILTYFSIVLSTSVGYLVGKIITRSEAEALDEVGSKNQRLINMAETNTALLSIVSHDLANHIMVGLNNAKFYSKKAQIDPNHKKYIDKVNQSFVLMKSIIDEVRTIRAEETGILQIELRDVCLIESLQESYDFIHQKAQEKKISVNFKTNGQKELHIQAEPVSLINSVFNNLLNNAIKFTPKGGAIFITIKESQEHAMVIIKDTGIGIPRGILVDLFNPNAMTSRKGTNGEPGTGFGMPIMKMFIDKYDAKLAVDSHTSGPQTGTSFQIQFKKSVSYDLQEEDFLDGSDSLAS